MNHPTTRQSIQTARYNLARSRRALPLCRKESRVLWHEAQIRENTELLARLEQVPENERDVPFWQWINKQGDICL